MKFLSRLDRWFEVGEGCALIIILFAMICIAFLQVLLRNFFHTALPWGDGLTRALVLWAGFVGASLAVRQGRFLSIDVLSRRLGAAWQRRTRLLIYLYAALVSFFLGWGGVTFVRSELAAMTMTSIGLPNWIITSIIPATFFLLCFRFSMKTAALLLGGELEKHEWER